MDRSATVKRRILRVPQVRGANRAVLLQMLRQTEQLSRADLARQCGLSEATVSRIVSELIEERLVIEDGAENSTGGRPGTRLRLDPQRVGFGADIQNWETRCSVSNMRGRLLESRCFRTPPTPEATLDLIVREYEACRARYGRDLLEVPGISARGIVNSETGVVEIGNHPAWVKVPVREYVMARLRGAVLTENNVRAAALAEYAYGAAEVRRSHCFLFVKVDEGVGVGIILDGRIYSGSHMAAGEFGQMIIASGKGPERGVSLEELACSSAICHRYAQKSGRRMAGASDTTARVRRICQEALAGNGDARWVLSETARYLGTGIANVVWGLDADVVVLDGPMVEAWPFIEPILLAQMPERGDLSRVVLRPSALGGDAALIGAATLAFAGVFATGKAPRAAQAPA